MNLKINLEGQEQGQAVNGPELQQGNIPPCPEEKPILQPEDPGPRVAAPRPKYTYTRFWFIKKRVIRSREIGSKRHVRYYVEWSK